MDEITKNQCIAQLQSLVSGLQSADEQHADALILEICAGLMQIVDKAPAVDALSEEELDDRLQNHLSIYHSMKKFMSAAAQTVDLTTAQKELTDAETLYQQKKRRSDRFP